MASELQSTPPPLPTSWRQSPIAQPSRISFLDLPRELRDQIYIHALCTPGLIFIYTRSMYQPSSSLSSKIVRRGVVGPVEPQAVASMLSPFLLAVSAQLHAEAAPVLYGLNFFRFWVPGTSELAGPYRALVRHVRVTIESAHLVFGSRDLEAVSHGWKHRFWPRVLASAATTLAQFPNADSVVVPIKAPVEAGGWWPAFFQLGGKTAVRRVELAAQWMGERSPWEEEGGRVREVLGLELEAPPGTIGKEEYVGSRFAPDEEEEWDYGEFGAAFELMKVIC
ncbi:hypothetical protein SVAN01_04364 [Stagonosporopsis vannaccii]|nr:hypothetical protein SVAN01_04364 [Stagonosporopsis vannaccii]